MRKRVFLSLATSGLLMLLTVPSASAHSAAGLQVEIPFDFVVRGQELPQGLYKVRANSPGLLQLQSGDLKVTVFSTPQKRLLGTREPQLVFQRIGDKNVLAEVWGPNNDGVRVLFNAREIERLQSGGGA